MTSEWKVHEVSESQPITAWMSWWFDLEKLWGLKGLDEPFQAECEKGHTAPEADCNCGIPAYCPPQPAPVREQNVVGEFKLWGRVLERDINYERLRSGIQWDLCDPLMGPYYRAQYAYPDHVWVLDPKWNDQPDPLVEGPGSRPSRVYHVWASPLEWIDVLLCEGHSSKEIMRSVFDRAAVTEEVRQGWQPAEGLHVRWCGFWRWRRPKIVRRLVYDTVPPLEAGLVAYGLNGIANVGQYGRRPVLIYTGGAR